MLRASLLIFLAALGLAHQAVALDPSVRQLVVSIAPDWDSFRGQMQRFERDGKGRWRAVSTPVPVLYGKGGLAWGRGVFDAGAGEPGPQKRERDKRAPAGVFRIGKVYGYDAQPPKGADYPYHQVTAGDAWVDDPSLPNYNRHVTVDPADPPPWFEKAKMRHNDFAYHWLVEIRHNADPPVPGAGSAIFFHIRRGENRPTSGCTTMAREDLEAMIRWLRADANPHYVLLPRDEYVKRWKSWGLPDPVVVGQLWQ
jgi:L,D-peptidoglycan transpeptidase YkuD (ErfK/YbiS/YcfS/YnhG family)